MTLTLTRRHTGKRCQDKKIKHDQNSKEFKIVNVSMKIEIYFRYDRLYYGPQEYMTPGIYDPRNI